jgi:hypothetical protein
MKQWLVNASATGLVITTFVAALALLPVTVLSQDNVLHVSAEANHRIRFDNGKVRMYEIELIKGKTTAFHEHTADNFAVVLNTTSRITEPKDGQRAAGSVKAGLVAFATTAKGPYTHRIEATGDVPFRVIAMEILNMGRLGDAPSASRRSAPFVVAVAENPRGQAYRLFLKPGESVGPFDRPRNTAIFAIAGGRTSEVIEGGAPRLWDSETGSFRWVDEAARLTIRNEGSTEVELLEIEVF